MSLTYLQSKISQFSHMNTFMRLSITIAILFILFVSINIITGFANENRNIDAPKVYPVKVETVKYLDSHMVRHEFTGHIVAGRRSSLGFELGGRLAHVFKDTGDEVKQGEPIASLDMSRTEARLRGLKAQKHEISARLVLAKRSLERRKKTFNDSHTSEQVLDEAIASENSIKAQLEAIEAEIDLMEVDLNASTLKAPFDGFIDRRLLDEGVIVNAGTPVVNILEQSNYEAQVGVPNEYVSLLKVGETASLQGEEGDEFAADVLRISPAIRGETRTQLVNLRVESSGNVSFGQLVTLRVDSERTSRGFWVPITALTADVRGLWRLFKLEDNQDDKTQPAKIVVENVQILHVDEERVFVSGSINDGDRVVSVGVSKITPNQLVRPIVE